jgi:ABC-type transporter Mla subunit MlaD
MSTRGTKNNVKAGVFVVASIALLMGITITLTGAGDWFSSKKTYVVRFDLADGAMGLKNGSEIRVGGQTVGKVVAVSYSRPPKSREVSEPASPAAAPAAGGLTVPRHVYVTVEVRADIALYSDAVFGLELPLLGSVSVINIPDTGGRGSENPASPGGAATPAKVLADWQMVRGTLAPPTVLAQAGYGPEQKRQMQLILEGGTRISDRMQSLIIAAEAQAIPALANVNETTRDVRRAVGDTVKQFPDWTTLISQTLRSVQSAAFEGDQRVREAKAVMTLVGEVLADAKPKVSAILTSVQSTSDRADKFTAKIDTELYATVKKALEEGERTIANAEQTSALLLGTLREEVPKLQYMMANLRLAGDQLKLTITEVRRSPWRLLYQPKRKEIEEELTYDAARTYAEAAGNLRAASIAIQAVLDAQKAQPGPLTDAQRNQLADLTKNLAEAFAEYDRVNRAFTDRLLGNPAKSAETPANP